MIKLTDIKVGKKLALLSGVSIFLLACVGGLALWTLNDSNAAAAKAQHYAHKLELSVKLDARLSELALRMSNLVTSRHLHQEAQEVLGLRREYAADFQYLKQSATTDEDRALLSKIEEVIAPWRDLNNRTIQAIEAGRHVDAGKVREESLVRFEALKAAVGDYLKYRQGRLDKFQEEQKATVSRVELWLIVVSLFAVAAALLLSRQISLSLSVPLERAVMLLESAADGNLVLEVTAKSLARQDEIGMLGRAVQRMSAGLRDVVKGIHQGIGVLSSSSAELVRQFVPDVGRFPCRPPAKPTRWRPRPSR
jgi:methyl-accepting chemotaxis protein